MEKNGVLVSSDYLATDVGVVADGELRRANSRQPGGSLIVPIEGKGEGGVGDLKQGQGCEFGKQSPELKRPKSTHAFIADGDAVMSHVHLDGFRY
jgi:hypothetical protein